MSAFATRVDDFLAELFRLDPVRATDAGFHGHDARWPDMTEAGRSERLAFYAAWSAELAAMQDAGLGADERIDRDLLLDELDAFRFTDEELREECWDPLSWVYLVGSGLFPLIALEFAPLAERLASVAGRLEGLPDLLDAARPLLVGHAGRPVSRLHAETALSQLPGIDELIGEAVQLAEEALGANPAVAALQPRLAQAASVARDALAAFETHLRETVLPASRGDGRLGEELFAARMRHTLRIGDMTPERILERAEREYAAVHAEMVRLARSLWPSWCPDRPAPADDGEVVRAVLDAIAAHHPQPGELLDYCRAELARIEAFCRQRDLVGLADEPLEIRWTPTFLRQHAGAMLVPPGPLDRGQRSFFAITPLPDDWSPEQVESALREDNDRMLRLLTIHEAVPGHYLQLAYANRCPSIARGVFWSGVFAEGWAVYVTQVMMDVGYGADDPALLLTNWKFYLRAVINAIVDVRIHCRAMTQDEAVRLMVEGGFQEESEARSKYNRARLTSTQLSTYFVGSMELWEIELERRRRLATAAAAPPSAVAARSDGLPGGLGQTPGFRYREHLEAVLAHGSPPIRLLRRILFD